MKNTYSIAQRNALVEEHLPCIDALMQRERKTIRKAHLDPEDLYQQLALRLIKAVGSFDPDKGKLEAHITAQLRYELQSCLRPSRRFGVTNTHGNFDGKVVSLEDYYGFTAQQEMAMAA